MKRHEHVKPSPITGLPPPDTTGLKHGTLTCTHCGETKPVAKFPKLGGDTYKKLKQTDPRRYGKKCKLCLKPVPANAGPDYVHKEPLSRNRSGKRKKKSQKRSKLTAAKSKARVRIETRIKSMLYLSDKGCEECGERDPRKLEYDHKNPANKHRGISRLITDGYSWSSAILRAEIRKCRILCANCHRVHTIKQQGYYASPEVQSTLELIADDYDFKV